MADLLLELKNASVFLKRAKKEIPIVTDVSFSVQNGETVALVGESGSGKTVLALSLMRLLSEPPFARPKGEALFYGKDLYCLKERDLKKIRGKKIAFIFQDPSACLDPLQTIGAQLAEGLEEEDASEELEEKLIGILKDVGIQDPEKRLYEYPHRLSGGMKQRILIASVLLMQPDLIIADEPTTALDATLAKQVMGLLKRVQQQNNSGLLLITHDIHLVKDMADTVLVMYAGEIVEAGPAKRVLEEPLHPYTQGLLASLPIKGKPLHPIAGAIPDIGDFPGGCRFNPRCPYVFNRCLQSKVPFFAREEGKRLARCLLLDTENASS